MIEYETGYIQDPFLKWLNQFKTDELEDESELVE